MLGWTRRDASRTLARHALPPAREPSLFTSSIDSCHDGKGACSVGLLLDGVDDFIKNDAGACVS